MATAAAACKPASWLQPIAARARGADTCRSTVGAFYWHHGSSEGGRMAVPSSLKSVCVLRGGGLWQGKSHLGAAQNFELRRPSLARAKKPRAAARGVVLASLLGVGAPEVLVIGVVALLVFGPKGLAEVARNLGKTLRTFQPTIRELQQVSQEFRNTLEQEIRLDDPRDGPPRQSYRPPPSSSSLPSDLSPPEQGAYTAEDYARFTDEQMRELETQRRASAAAAWGGNAPDAPKPPQASQGPAPSSQLQPPGSASPPTAPSSDSQQKAVQEPKKAAQEQGKPPEM